MPKQILIIVGSALLLITGFLAGSRTPMAHAGTPAPSADEKSYAPTKGVVPKSYGRMVAAIADNIGTGLVFEDAEGVIRFVSITGMKEGELARYDTIPTRGGIPKSYGHLISAVVNNGATGLIFEDAQGVIRFVTLAGKTEGELTRE